MMALCVILALLAALTALAREFRIAPNMLP